jgi:serine/threonine protein kinase
MKQLLEAVSDMHDRQIVHRDIKPENILIKNSKKAKKGGPKALLADFGIACLIFDESLTKQLCGTPGYIDPYILNPPVGCTNFCVSKMMTLKSDIFSIGSVFFGMVAG